MALKEALKDFDNALNRLKEAYLRAKNCSNEDYYFFRDSAIQRFEFTVEILRIKRSQKKILKEHYLEIFADALDISR